MLAFSLNYSKLPSHFNQIFLVTRQIHRVVSSKFLKSKVALVTGSTSGIGLEAAHSLASNGANIVLSGFGDDALITSIKSDIKGKHQVECQHIPVDLKVQSEVDKFINNVMKSNMKGIDILINNAGFQYVSKVNEFPVEKWNDIIAVLLTSPFLLIRSFLPSMMERGWGRIINIGSVHSLKASPNKAAYCSAKHGLVGLTKVVALETAGTGVTCNLISPGFVDTPILQSQVLNLADKENISYEKAKKLFLSHYHPSGEAITVEQVSALCVHLCSQAADQITGSNLVVDGGWTSK